MSRLKLFSLRRQNKSLAKSVSKLRKQVEELVTERDERRQEEVEISELISDNKSMSATVVSLQNQVTDLIIEA